MGDLFDVLHYATTPYMYTNDVCNTNGKVDGVLMWGKKHVTDRQMCWSRCWEDMEVCPGSGDSGRPLVIINDDVHTQVGVVSYGTASGKKPDVLTRVSIFCQW